MVSFAVDSFFSYISFDRFNMYDSYTSNIPEVKRMSSMIHSMVEKQMMLGVKPENIVLGGFSQGGALAMYASLTCPVHTQTYGTYRNRDDKGYQ